MKSHVLLKKGDVLNISNQRDCLANSLPLACWFSNSKDEVHLEVCDVAPLVTALSFGVWRPILSSSCVGFFLHVEDGGEQAIPRETSNRSEQRVDR